MTTTINRADWIETSDGRIGKACWLEADGVFALMDDTGAPELVPFGRIAKVVPAR